MAFNGSDRIAVDHDQTGAKGERSTAVGQLHLMRAVHDELARLWVDVEVPEDVSAIGVGLVRAARRSGAAAGAPAGRRARAEHFGEWLGAGGAERVASEGHADAARVRTGGPFRHDLPVEERRENVHTLRHASDGDRTGRDAIDAEVAQPHAANGVVASDEVVLEEAQRIGRLRHRRCALLKEEGRDDG